jgi:hypothetical protein
LTAIEPPEPRATVVRDATGLRITIPVKRSWLVSLFLTGWLGLWGVGGGTTLLRTLRGERGDDWFTLAFLAIWAVGSVHGAYAWLWQLAGQEIVTVRPSSLVLRREIFGFGRSREFELRHVRDLRVTASSAGARVWGLATGPLAFGYGSRTYRFGGGVDEAEARDLVRWIKQAAPLQPSA